MPKKNQSPAKAPKPATAPEPAAASDRDSAAPVTDQGEANATLPAPVVSQSLG